MWSAGSAQPYLGPPFAIQLFETEHIAKPLAPLLVQSAQVRRVRSQTPDLDGDALPEGASRGLAAVESGALVCLAQRAKDGARRGGGGGGGGPDTNGEGGPSAAGAGAAPSERPDAAG